MKETVPWLHECHQHTGTAISKYMLGNFSLVVYCCCCQQEAKSWVNPFTSNAPPPPKTNHTKKQNKQVNKKENNPSLPASPFISAIYRYAFSAGTPTSPISPTSITLCHLCVIVTLPSYVFWMMSGPDPIFCYLISEQPDSIPRFFSERECGWQQTHGNFGISYQCIAYRILKYK